MDRDQSRGVMRPAIAELRLRDQERDGVAAEVIYGILGSVNRLDDPEVAASETGLPVHIHTVGPPVDTRWLSDPAT